MQGHVAPSNSVKTTALCVAKPSALRTIFKGTWKRFITLVEPVKSARNILKTSRNSMIIFHVHTNAIVARSSLRCGVLTGIWEHVVTLSRIKLQWQALTVIFTMLYLTSASFVNWGESGVKMSGSTLKHVTVKYLSLSDVIHVMSMFRTCLTTFVTNM